MQDLNVTLVQTDLYWESTTANLAMLEEKIWTLVSPTDLIILPEMFSTGFSMEAETLAEPMNSTTFKWMKQMAQQRGAVITGSFIVKENGLYFNRLLWMSPDGSYDSYDKRHLFRLGKEHEKYTCGQERMIKTLKGWKICPLICYDLRFPLWARNRYDGSTGLLDYDLLIYVASWPSPRIPVWDTLLKGRAMENWAYTIGVNRIGTDGNGLPYSGHSVILDPKGETLFSADDRDCIHTLSLSADDLGTYRDKFPFYKDADAFLLS